MSLPSDVAQSKEEQILHIKNKHLIEKFGGYYEHHAGTIAGNLIHHIQHMFHGHSHDDHAHGPGNVPAAPTFSSLSPSQLLNRQVYSLYKIQ